MNLSLADIRRCHHELKTAGLKETPLVYNRHLSEHLGLEVWLKLESLQPSGSFKIRPATYGILSQFRKAQEKGIVSASSGNFAQATAYAAKHWGIKARIVMMENSSPYKIRRVRDWGAEVHLCRTYEERDPLAKAISQEYGSIVLHPHSSYETILADATVGLELLDSGQTFSSLICPASGCGLVGGITEALALNKNKIQIFAAQPEANSSLKLSLETGKPVSVSGVTTIADALIATKPGMGFEILQRHAVTPIIASEAAISEAVALFRELTGLWVEPGGATGLASVLETRPNLGESCVFVVTGSNLDPSK